MLIVLLSIFILPVAGYALAVKMVQVNDCSPTSNYACIKMPGTNSGYALILTKADQGNPIFTWPTSGGEIATREWVLQQIGPSPSPTPTPTPTPTPVPTPTPTPTPVAIAIDAKATMTGSGQSFPWTHTVGASATILVGGCTTDEPITAVTAAGR